MVLLSGQHEEQCQVSYLQVDFKACLSQTVQWLGYKCQWFKGLYCDVTRETRARLQTWWATFAEEPSELWLICACKNNRVRRKSCAAQPLCYWVVFSPESTGQLTITWQFHGPPPLIKDSFINSFFKNKCQLLAGSSFQMWRNAAALWMESPWVWNFWLLKTHNQRTFIAET